MATCRQARPDQKTIYFPPTSSHFYKVVKNPKLHLQLDAISEPFVRSLKLISVGILKAKNRNIEQNDKNINKEQVSSHLIHSIAIQAILSVEEREAGFNVDARDKKLLKEKSGNLDFFVDHEWMYLGV